MLDHRTVARMYAWLRIALGAALAVAPTLAGRPWIGEIARHPDARGPLRVLGVRDAVLGVALLGTPDNSRHRRDVLALCGLVDAGDALVTLRDSLRTKRVGAVLSAVTAAMGAGIAFSARAGAGRAH